MNQDFSRIDRISENLLRALALIVQENISDPRLKGLITLSHAKVTKDLSIARIYFTSLLDDPKLVGEILNKSAPFLRGQLAKTIKLRKIPKLNFIFDSSVEYANKINQLIKDQK